MADFVKFSQADANASKNAIEEKANAMLNGDLKRIKVVVEKMRGPLEGEFVDGLLDLYNEGHKEIQKIITEFITKYNNAIDGAVKAMNDADDQVKRSVRSGGTGGAGGTFSYVSL